ncbi:MAG: recombinase RecT [bacterium]|nr:recombinase RecT [bacterium]
MDKETKLVPAETAIKQFFEINKDKLAKILPKDKSPDRFMMSALTECWKNKDLQNADKLSLFNAVLEAAELGIEVGSTRGLAHLVMFGNQVKLMLDYKGLIELVGRSDNVVDIRAREVRENDTFDVDYGMEEKLVHKPMLTGDRGKPMYYYAIIKFKDGTVAFDYMDMDEIKKARGKSKTQKVWNEWPEEMAKKTIIRRLLKTVPKYIEKVQQAMNKDAEVEYGKMAVSSSDVAGEITDDNLKKLEERLEEE